MSYAIDDGDGTQITAGLAPQTAHRTAQRLADERGESVYLYDDERDGDASEIAPTSIDVLLDTPNGPLVEYGGHDVETVEAEIPAGHRVDWTNQIEISVSGTHTARYRAPLVSSSVTVRFAVLDGEPSTHYPEDEQAVNGALDYDVTLTIGDQEIEGGITLYPDRANGGTMGPCGSPRDGWVSSTILVAIDKLGEMAAREILGVLACGTASNGDEITVEVRP